MNTYSKEVRENKIAITFWQHLPTNIRDQDQYLKYCKWSIQGNIITGRLFVFYIDKDVVC